LKIDEYFYENLKRRFDSTSQMMIVISCFSVMCRN